MLTINDLAGSELLDADAMATISGGFDPFVHTGLRSMMEDMLGWPPLEKGPEVSTTKQVGGLEEPLVIRESNYKEVTG